MIFAALHYAVRDFETGKPSCPGLSVRVRVVLQIIGRPFGENKVGSSRAPCRILVVDDDRMQNELMSAYCVRLGLDLSLDCVLTVNDAIASIGAHRPDIVFLDNRIPPEIDFRSSIERIRSAGYDGTVIVQSVVTDDPVFDDARSLGIACVVDKFELRENRLRELVSAYWSADVQTLPEMVPPAGLRGAKSAIESI